jgi:hypothetical protein
VIELRDQNVNGDGELSQPSVKPDELGQKQPSKDPNPWLECVAWNLLLSEFL